MKTSHPKLQNGLSGDGYDAVLEVGPGMGVLTKYLLEKDQKLMLQKSIRNLVVYLKNIILNLKIIF
jgi:16S rRNA (adenine1518-N6/adenine1519-N6)-dimethyltransferase